MNSTQRPLTGFEERLLTELRRTIVAERPESRLDLAEKRARRRLAVPRRIAITAAVVVVLAVASTAGVPLLPGGDGVAPAYAVAANDDGTVTVEINSLRDAAGLERQLREAGIPAVVQYLPPGKACKEPTFAPAQAAPGSGKVSSSLAGHGAGVPGTLSFTIDPGTIVPGQTLVIYTAEVALPPGEAPPGQAGQPQQLASSIGMAWAQGEVKRCEVVEAADAAPGPGNPPGSITSQTGPGGGTGQGVQVNGATP